MPLKIAYITDERYPSPHTDCQQVVKTMDALGALGCEVHLIEPRMAVHYFKSRAQVKKEICDTFNVEGRFEVHDIRHVPGSDLRIEKVTHGILGPLKALRGQYDVVHTRNLNALVFGAVLHLPMLYENYKAMPVSTPKSWRIARAAINRPGVLGLVTHSYYAAQTMTDKVNDPDAVIGIPNGFDPKDFEHVPEKGVAKQQIGMAEIQQPLAVYAGHIRPDKGISTLVDLAEDSPLVHFLIVGGTEAEVGVLQKEISKRRLVNMTLKSRVEVAEVPRYLAAADVLLLPTAKAPLLKGGKSTVLPMKVFSYLAAARPILAPNLPDTEGVLTHNVNCLKVPPDDRKAAAEALHRLCSDRSLATRLQEKAAADASGFTWNGRAEKLIAFMNKRISKVRQSAF